MDSLTQIVLGAAVGEAVLGKKAGNKAMLYGAIAGTIPDLDTFSSFFTDTITATEIHRGFTHSILFSLFFAPILGWLIFKIEKNNIPSIKDWSYLVFWSLFTHPLLDAHTTWGTQLFWPLDLRIAYKNIFVIDPLYTLPFIIFLLITFFQKKGSPKRKRYNQLGIIISSIYMMFTIGIKIYTYQIFLKSLKENHIDYINIETKPAPFTSFLWTANIETEKNYLIANYSIFDTQKIKYKSYPKNHHYLKNLSDNETIKRLIKITKGWYTITNKHDQLYFNDLRFGVLSLEEKEPTFAFSYKISNKNNIISITEVPKNKKQAKKLLSDLWIRIWGN